jgi:asparagine synthase (glutamine-hydrolysing)
MCGVAGMADLTGGKRPVPTEVLQAMQQALFHRGPDEGGLLVRPGVGLASRRLSIVGLADGQQPMSNEDGSVWVAYNGELFDYPELKPKLEARGHVFRTHCDTELIPHLWEDHQERLFEHLRGQFAFALFDERRQRLVLGRDRFGIHPLYWTRQGGWFLFASEVKALLASGMVEPKTDLRAINHVFTFFALPGPVTCFEGVSILLPGHYLDVNLAPATGQATVTDHVYWRLEFPPQGHEDPGGDPRKLVDRFQELLLQSVRKRLRADVPVVSYLSGGVDSAMVVALATKVRGEAVPTFTVGVDDPRLNETTPAMLMARHVGAKPFLLHYGATEAVNTYPRLITANEGPVIDVSSAALVLLAEEVHRQGYKVTLTGEGSDEWLAGYSWYKLHKVLGWLDGVPGLPLGQWAKRAWLRLAGLPRFPWEYVRRNLEATGGPNAWHEVYGLMGLSKLRFFSKPMLDLMADQSPYADLELEPERIRRWHPLNRGLWFGWRIHLPGLLLSAKGDRVAMHSSVEARYPFLDEDVCDFVTKLAPRWKLNGFREKYLLRKLAERWVPRSIAWGPKAMFMAPWDSFHREGRPAFVDQLLSEESLRKTGYFDPEAVRHWRTAYVGLRPNSAARTSVEMGLVGVVATQLWHHLYVDASLADIPGRVWEW